MNRSLDALTSEFKPLAIELIARLVERGVQPLIVQTLRTLDEHRINLDNKSSRTARSKHLPRSLRGFASGTADDGKADAIDLCPFEVYQLAGPDKLAWRVNTPEARRAFGAIGEVSEMLGLRWGGRWLDPQDYGHAEWVFDYDAGHLAAERARPWPLTV